MMNAGKPSEKNLTAQEKWLRHIYRKALTMCNSEPALREGDSFDLMCVNLQNPGFNPHRIFAFLRYTSDSVLLIIANFNTVAEEVNVKIPQLAFDMANIPQGNLVADDLLCDRSVFLNLKPDCETHVFLNPKDATVLRIR